MTDNTNSVLFQVSIRMNKDQNGSENWKENKISCHAYFAVNQKEYEKPVSKIHENIKHLKYFSKLTSPRSSLLEGCSECFLHSGSEETI